jgi:hypothetical protein
MQIAKRYIFPPRPQKAAVPYERVDMYKRAGWYAQLKYNDKRTVFSIEHGKAEIFNRHHTKHKTYNLSEELRDEIVQAAVVFGLDTDQWNYLDGGLLHGKHKLMKDTFVIWDILVRNGDWLLNTTYKSRYDTLASPRDPFMVDINGTEFNFGIKITDHIFVPRLWENYQEAWDYVKKVNDAAGWKEGQGECLLEGLVVKNPAGRLKPAFKEENNAEWQSRCRIKTGRHKF